MRVLTLGTFDLFHVGHLNLLNKAAALGDSLWVGVNSDRFCADYKRPPIIGQRDRLQIVQAIKCVDAAVVNDGPGRDVIERVRPDVLAVGTDWLRRDYLAQVGGDQMWLEELGITLAFVPYTFGISTTKVIARVIG